MIPRDVVLLATADWDNPFWTNKQHMACQLAERGHRVLYIESLGLRRPSARARDLSRIGRRLRRALAAPRPVRPGLWVWSPLVLPLQRYAPVRTLNRHVLQAALQQCTRRLGFGPSLLWTYNPMTTRLLDTEPFVTVVYHCVDDIAAQPGMPADVLAGAEKELLRAARVVFATAPNLAETRGRWNTNTHYLPNVADYAHFSRALDPALAVPDDLSRIPRPRLGFVGAISGYKVDFELLRHVAESRPDWSLVLLGQVGEGDPWTDPRMLEGLPNLHLLGPRPYASLPACLKAMDVALLPSPANEYTASMFPMKFFEYLAAGCPVVSTDLPALRPFRRAARLAQSRDDFMAGIAEALRGEGASLQQRLDVARAHTYATRTDRMLAILRESLAAPHASGRAA